MIIKKRVQGTDIILEYEEKKTYPHGFTTYDVYKITGKKIFLYTTTLTKSQIEKIKTAGYMINEEVELDVCS